MSEVILVTALGEHPAVVTGMVKAMREIAGIRVDSVSVLYPQDSGTKYIDREGMGMVADALKGQCRIVPEPLPFADANTRERSMRFLQIAASILQRYDDPDRYSVYLSLAGGRKHMSALLALVAQFFPAVKGLYHLLDRREGQRGISFPSIEEMELTMSEDEQQAALDPPLDQLSLVAVPYPGAFANAAQLWSFVKDPDAHDVVPLAPEAEAFYRTVLQPREDWTRLEVWLSSTAVEQFREFPPGSTHANGFLTAFRQMRDATLLKNGQHGTLGKFSFYKRRRTAERPFFYTWPNPIHLHPKKPVQEVVICGLSIESESRHPPYQPTGEELLKSASREKCCRLSDLIRREHVLVVPLGLSPMVVTQTYTLLSESPEEGTPKIPVVTVVYPELDSRIRAGVELLRKQFALKGVDLLCRPVAGYRDADSEEACKAYLRTILRAITDLRQQFADHVVSLSLSGGRKGMSALTLFAAQRAGVDHVYHTLITDPNLERQVEDEASLDSLHRLPSDDARAQRLFLGAYPRDRFALFSIPVITVEDQPGPIA